MDRTIDPPARARSTRKRLDAGVLLILVMGLLLSLQAAWLLGDPATVAAVDGAPAAEAQQETDSSS